MQTQHWSVTFWIPLDWWKIRRCSKLQGYGNQSCPMDQLLKEYLVENFWKHQHILHQKADTGNKQATTDFAISLWCEVFRWECINSVKKHSWKQKRHTEQSECSLKKNLPLFKGFKSIHSSHQIIWPQRSLKIIYPALSIHLFQDKILVLIGLDWVEQFSFASCRIFHSNFPWIFIRLNVRKSCFFFTTPNTAEISWGLVPYHFPARWQKLPDSKVWWTDSN